MYEFTPQHSTRFSQHTHLVLAVRFQDSFFVEDRVPLTFVPAEELAPFNTAHLDNTIICVWDFPYIVEIGLRVNLMRLPRLGDR